jgi:uncharacterized protein YkwD
VFVVGALIAPTVVAGRSVPSSSARAMVTLQTGVLQQLNRVRAAHGLVPLKLNVQLSKAAAGHTKDMAAHGYFGHTSADGSSFWKRVQNFYVASKFGYWSVGENLLWSAHDLSPKSALELWMASPHHRTNILTERWREVGISAVYTEAAPGSFGGQPVTVITTDFGVRR